MSEFKYIKTHPWLSFNINLSKMTFSFWFLLGAAQSKCKHIAGIPMKPEFAQSLQFVSLAKGALATTAIEGNTLSLAEVKAQINKEGHLPKSREYLGKEIDNIVNAFNYVGGQELVAGASKLSVSEIKKYHKLILDGLELSEEVIPGEIRTHSVGVAMYRGAPAQDCDYLLSRLCEWINNDEEWSSIGDDKRLAAGILKAMVAHLYFAWIHPFGDGNGRTARLIELKLLLDAGIPATAAHLLSNFYNDTRTRYYSVLEETSKGTGCPELFMMYALQGFVDNLDLHIEQILDEQIHVAWINYVHEKYKKFSTQVKKRQRDLLLEITEIAHRNNVFCTKQNIERGISQALFKEYANSEKKLSRDLSALINSKMLTIQYVEDLKEEVYAPDLNIIKNAYMSPCIRE